MMKKLLAAAAFASLAPLGSGAVLIDIDGGLGYSFNSITKGDLGDGAISLEGSSVNQDVIGLSQEAEGGVYFWSKVSVPIFPDIGLRYQHLVSSGTNEVNSEVEFGGESRSFSGTVESELDMSYLDLTLSYGVPLPIATIDFGLNLRSLLGGLSIEESNGNESLEARFETGSRPIIVPMFYLAAAVNVPVVDARLNAEVKTLPLGDTSITDWEVKATWFAPMPSNALVRVGAEAGYRSYSLSIGDTVLGTNTSDLQSEIGFSGFFLGIAASF